jgi:hypothetical protein
MTKPDNKLLENCDPDDVSDALVAVKRSFGIEYSEKAFEGVKTFGELCDVVVATIGREHRDGSTAQQAFYKLRSAIGGAEAIKPATNLNDLFPRIGRRRRIQDLQWALGVRLELLKMKSWIGWALFAGYLLAFLSIFINWRYGVTALAGVFLANRIALRFPEEFTCETVGDAARLFARDHYRRARRDPETVNREEIVPIIKAIFHHMLNAEPEVMTRNAAMGW